MKPAVRPRELQIALRQALGDISGLTPITEGEESRAFGFRRGADHFVVRVNPSAQGFRKDAFAHRHFATTDLPIPEVVAIGTLADGHAWCVSRRMPGMTLQELGPFELSPVLEPVAQVMNAIAASDVSITRGFGPFDATGTGRYASWRDFLMSVADRVRDDRLGARSGADDRRLGRLVDLICDLAHRCPEVRRLVHGDFGSNNVVTDGHRVTGVIDWSEALLGDPLYDVANILFWRSWLDCMSQQARHIEERQPELRRHSERLCCYQLRIGVEQICDAIMTGDERLAAWAASRCDEIAADGPA